MSKPRMTKQQVQVLEVIEQYLVNMRDAHFVDKKAVLTKDQRIYIDSWVLPKLTALIDHGKNGKELPSWAKI